MSFDPMHAIQDHWVFGEYGDVNPSITDSSTYTFMSPDKMRELFDHEIEGCFLYSRHWNPINKELS
ncbi:MAG TPA: cystathionine beta-lyase, partial [bacterium]|nr:cystathionine beta-lyase [bacterium]